MTSSAPATALQPFRTLLSPIRIGTNVLKSRLLYPNASPHFLQGPEVFPAEGYRTYVASVARNGAAVVTVAEWNEPAIRSLPADLDISHMQVFDPLDPSVQNYLSLMSEDVHFFGSKIIVSPRLEWPEGYSLRGGERWVGPGFQGEPPVDLPLPAERMHEVVDAFVDKLRSYRNCGYDGVTLHCDMEILPGATIRGDAYDDGTIESRSRLLREVYRAVKKEFGRDFITEAQIAWEQPTGYGPRSSGPGTTADEVAAFCHLVDADVDIFQIREHDGARSHPTGYNFQFRDHPAVAFAERLKQEGIAALLAPIGGFQEPEEMEAYLRDGKCDLFGVARAFIADPDYGQKIFEGRADDIVPCLKCNVCHGRVLDEPDPWVSVCCVNPTFGMEHELPRLIRISTPKRVAVIGGGATGMRAAIECVSRGHRVTLFEKTDMLGGQLAHADFFDFKWPLRNYRDWLIRHLDKRGVEVVMAYAPDPEDLAEQGFDAVIAATGAAPTVPSNIDGLHDADGTRRYATCDEMWGREPELGEHVVIVGGSEAGVEMAIHLARTGHTVTVLTRKSVIAHDASRLHYITMSFVKELPDGSYEEAPEWERYPTIRSIVGATTVRLEGDEVVYADADGALHRVVGDDVLICGGHRNLIDDALSYSATAPRFFAIGDCVGAGNVQVGTRQAFARASLI